jgi:hypothetical protein
MKLIWIYLSEIWNKACIIIKKGEIISSLFNRKEGLGYEVPTTW